MTDLFKRLALATAFTTALGGTLFGCAGGDTTADEDDLTSNTARERALAFEGYVYVDAQASDAEILAAVKEQNKSAFGAIRNAKIGANNRELGDIDVKSFVREPVTLVDPKHPTASGTPELRVRYRYTDRALVPISMAKRSAVSVALMQGDYQAQSKRILDECTESSTEDKEFESAIWYVFNPSLDSCKTAMQKEQAAIDAAHAGLKTDQITSEELNRLYLPITVKLEATKTSKATTYPEYDKLWSGKGVSQGELVVGIVSGVMADWAANEKPELQNDIGYHMYYEQMSEIMKVYPKLALVSTEGTDLTSFQVNGKNVGPVTFADLSHWELDESGWPTNISYSEHDALRKAVADKLAKHWIRFEQPVTVKIGTSAQKPLKIVINTYYGAETDDAPHRRALQTSDVFIYNGHSYIGYGPLDPSRYSASDFPSTYQLFVMNSCVSFNYYEKDFFEMHAGGTKNLDMITNGLESPVYGSGPAMGRLVGALLSGKGSAYKTILTAASNGAPETEVGADALRVVDGELDNAWKPSKTKVTVTAN